MNAKDYIITLVVCANIVMTACLAYGYYNKSNAYDQLLQTAVRFQQACVAAGPACVDLFEGKNQVNTPKAK